MRRPCCVAILAMVLLVSSAAAAAFWSSDPVTPVVFIPGKGGNQLEAKLDKPSAPVGCQKTSGWFRIWLSLWSVLVGE